MRAPALASLLLLLPALTGCLAPSPVDEAHVVVDPPFPEVPAVDAAAVLRDVKAYSEAFPLRRGDSETHNAARAHLAGQLAQAGLEVVLDEFSAPIRATSTPTALLLGSERLVNIVGFKWGVERPDEWIVVGAHYDVTDAAVYGAYDDGSGTMIVQHLAHAFAGVPTARTIVFVAFDGEEQGRRGSIHMVESLVRGEWVLDNGTVVGMVDFDMVGITWPTKVPLVADVVSPEMQAVIEAKRVELGIPDDMIAYRPIVGGNSDNGAFKAASIPSVLLISDFDDVRVEGQRVPGNYPFWHKLDTYDHMVLMAGGEEQLRAGFQNVVDIGATLLHAMADGLEMTFHDPHA